jgi:hypothetical protein
MTARFDPWEPFGDPPAIEPTRCEGMTKCI